MKLLGHRKRCRCNYNFQAVFNATGASLLARAVYLENIEIIKLLLDNGANPNLKDIFARQF